ncbi:His Kinase A (phospho-acceptor) domain-containing protein [Desulfonatronum thiosulfatophilum]|uniref:histidine kinase n=1 Tax=Desulfonatronum thiosulfatophilum TaxID=617002 RepID=A0A1G6CU91_9BACT|nr:sensor histidine kinase [Desulfonatronum thiosulfatophilum]SDB36392.1 His Kinase A (phospho-acceptor) domain-containing protein [Desulfonatronum thiosulfatophilum]
MRKQFVIAIAATFALISLAVFGLAFKANLELERIVSEQFNEQQLGLTRQISQDIEENFRLLEQSLSLLAAQITDPRTENDRRHETFELYYPFLQDWGLIGIGILSESDPAESPPLALFTEQGWINISELGMDLPPAAFNLHHPPHHQVSLGKTQKPSHGPFAQQWIMPMTLALPLSPQTENSRSSPGIVLFVLDAQIIASRHAAGVRSGKTGYAWIIDHEGRFMFHVEESFRGETSFTVRSVRNPAISYHRINELVDNRLLQGQEGTDWYTSGWHWHVTGEMRKLLAFSPIQLASDVTGDPHIWSVGLAAPDTEVYGLMQPVVVRQWLLAGLFFIGLTIAFTAFLFISLRWSEALRREVDKKTDHLQRSEAELRQERDKVQQSMEQLLQAQTKLLLAERFAAIGEAAAHLSHEIKNPLMLMGGFARQVQRTLPEDDARTQKLEIIAGEAKRLENLLLEVREFTRPPQPRKVETDITELITEVIRLFQEQAASQDIECRLDMAPGIPRCMLDVDQIKQVLINLIKNAMEAMACGGKLGIAASADERFVQIAIDDTGGGIPTEIMKKLFHPFFSTKPKGTGLGLAVSYKLVQDHGGDITVQSTEGRGTRFTVTLPT